MSTGDWNGICKKDAEQVVICEVRPFEWKMNALYPHKLIVIFEDPKVAWKILQTHHESPLRKDAANTCWLAWPDEVMEKVGALSKLSRKC